MQILISAGLRQGPRFCVPKNSQVVLRLLHLDHAGEQGWRGGEKSGGEKFGLTTHTLLVQSGTGTTVQKPPVQGE